MCGHGYVNIQVFCGLNLTKAVLRDKKEYDDEVEYNGYDEDYACENSEEEVGKKHQKSEALEKCSRTY